MTTPPHKVHPHTLVRLLMTEWIKRNWWWIAIPPVTAIVVAAALHDLRFLLVALIWVFLVAPPVMIIVYFYYALSPEARYSIRLHTITATPQGITISYPPEPSPEPDEAGAQNPTEATPQAFADDFIPFAEITSVKNHPQYLAIYLGSPYKIILIPHSIWDTPASATAFLRSLSTSLSTSQHKV